MAKFYYLLSSLPLLSYGNAPPLNCGEFIDACTDFLSANEINELQMLQLVPPDDYSGNDATVAAWYEWETGLRNALVNLRGKGKGQEAEKYLREEKDFFSEIGPGAQEAFNKQSPLEMEQNLDKMRWNKLDDMEVGHIFDFALLVIYKIKLMLCEKQQLPEKEKGSENFDHIVEDIYQKAKIAPMQIEE